MADIKLSASLQFTGVKADIAQVTQEAEAYFKSRKINFVISSNAADVAKEIKALSTAFQRETAKLQFGGDYFKSQRTKIDDMKVGVGTTKTLTAELDKLEAVYKRFTAVMNDPAASIKELQTATAILFGHFGQYSATFTNAQKEVQALNIEYKDLVGTIRALNNAHTGLQKTPKADQPAKYDLYSGREKEAIAKLASDLNVSKTALSKGFNSFYNNGDLTGLTGILEKAGVSYRTIVALQDELVKGYLRSGDAAVTSAEKAASAAAKTAEAKRAAKIDSKYDGVSDRLSQINSARAAMAKLSPVDDTQEYNRQAESVRRLSDEIAGLLGIKAKVSLFKDLSNDGDITRVVAGLQNIGVEADRTSSLIDNQAKANDRVAVSAAKVADDAVAAEKKKQEAIASTTAKMQRESEAAQARMGGKFFESAVKEVDLIGGDKEQIKTTKTLIDNLKVSYEQFVAAVKAGDAAAPVLLEKMAEDERKLTASLTNLRRASIPDNTRLTRSSTSDRAIADLDRYFKKNETNIRRNSVLMREFAALQDKIRNGGYGDLSVGTNLNALQADVSKFKRMAEEAGAEVETLSGRIKKLFSAHLGTALVMLGINALRKGLQDVWTNVKELDKAVVDLGIASGLSRVEIQGLVREYSKLGQEIGATTVEVAQSADSWLRQGYSIQESNKLIRDTMMLSKLGQLDSAEAARALTSAMKGYGVSVEDATSIVDKFVATDMSAAVTAGGLATALAETAVSAKIAGVSMDRIIGYIAKVSEVTQDGAESVGNFFKSTFARMGNIKQGRLVDPETDEDLNIWGVAA